MHTRGTREAHKRLSMKNEFVLSNNLMLKFLKVTTLGLTKPFWVFIYFENSKKVKEVVYSNLLSSLKLFITGLKTQSPPQEALKWDFLNNFVLVVH